MVYIILVNTMLSNALQYKVKYHSVYLNTYNVGKHNIAVPFLHFDINEILFTFQLGWD